MSSNLIVGPQCEEEVTLFKALLKGKVRGGGVLGGGSWERPALQYTCFEQGFGFVLSTRVYTNMQTN